MLIFDHKKMDNLLRVALEVVGQHEPLRSLNAVIVVHPHDCDGELCWELLNDPSKRPLVVLSIFPLPLLEKRDKGIMALLAQAGVGFTALPARTAAIVQAARDAEAKTAADPNAQQLRAAFAVKWMVREARYVAHDLANVIMSGNADKITVLVARAARVGITAASPEELLEKLRLAIKENEPPSPTALDRLNKL